MPRSNEKKLEWEERVRKQRESGLSIARWCQENHIMKSTFSYWRDKLSPKTLDQSSFTELVETRKGITVEYNGFCIHLDEHFDSTTFTRCIVALKEIKC